MNIINPPPHPHKTFQTPQTSRGSALIIILVAVALFGALSYVVAGMMRADSGINAISEQQAGLHASAILSYASSVRRAVQDVRISNGCEETQLSFEKPPFDNSDSYRNANSPSDFSCHIFHPDGGGVSASQPSIELQDAVEAAARSGILEEYLITASIQIPAVGTGDTATFGSDSEATTDTEILLILPWLNERICRKINEDINVSDDTMPTFQSYTQFFADHRAKFVGVFPSNRSSAGNHTLIRAESSFCAYDPTPGSVPGGGYHLYYTLMAR